MRINRTDTGAVCLRMIAFLAIALLLPCSVWAAGPAWWTTRGVIKTDTSADDYAAVNQGQVRHIAKQAYEEMKISLPGGPGAELDALWASPAASADDYRTVNLGQLKNVAKPFYDRFVALGCATDYPWSGGGKPADDYALANIGQAKFMFSFIISYKAYGSGPDSDGDGMPDVWERLYGLDAMVNDASQDLDQDGMSNYQECLSYRSPKDRADSAVRPQFVDLVLRLPGDEYRGISKSTWKITNVGKP